nr:MORC family CW-type zinc finger protein 3-like [Biomphalaria glabrata]
MASTLGIPLSKVSPAFLHANSTSHTWVFSAFAELIDNAYDPDVSASELLIDQIDIRDTPSLIFLDNGAGMDRDHLLKMLSFGFCEKDIYERQGSHQPIGHYGNGFKSGSMRIGLDALVFTRSQRSACIGFLSQTYLKAIQTDCVVVPILEYQRIKSQESRNNLNAILQYSVFKYEEELKAELSALEGSKTGTKIIISNLKRLQDGTYELDFSSDPTDIRCPEAHEIDLTSVYHRPVQHNASEYKSSLREYCSILFLRPRMKITIRGVRVKSKLVSKSLSNTEIDMYKPTWLSRPVKIIFGFTCETEKSEDYGMMLYHRNRLIKAYEKVGYQKQPNELGIGVVGVAQVDFLQPIHNKQDFNKDEKFNSVMAAFALKLNEYWNEKKGQQATASTSQTHRNNPDWLWAQCDQCLKWRRLPDGIDGKTLPDQWYCRMNPDATHNRCDIPEEPEDEDLAVKPTYEKTFKKKMEERKRIRQMEMEREDEIKKRKMMEKERELREKEAALRAIQRVPPPPDTHTVTALQKELAAARQREEMQRQLIQRIQEENKKIIDNLKSLKGKPSKDALDQMNRILESSLATLPNTKDLQMHTRKISKPINIKTESGEVVSVTQNNMNGTDYDGDDNEDVVTKHSSQGKTILPKKIKPKEVMKVSTSFVQPKSDLKTTVNGHPLKKTDAVSDPQASRQVSRQSRQQRKAEKLLAVIDLTSDKEFGELVDIKPDLDELRSSIQDSLLTDNADIKPDKGELDAVIAANSSDKSLKEKSAKVIPETKKEIIDSAYSETQHKNKLPKSGSDLKSSPVKTSSSHQDVSEKFYDNLEAALVAVRQKKEKERLEKTQQLSNGSLDLPTSSENLASDQLQNSNPKSPLDNADPLKTMDIKTEKDEQSIVNRLRRSMNEQSQDDMEEDNNDDSNDFIHDSFSSVPQDKDTKVISETTLETTISSTDHCKPKKNCKDSSSFPSSSIPNEESETENSLHAFSSADDEDSIKTNDPELENEKNDHVSSVSIKSVQHSNNQNSVSQEDMTSIINCSVRYDQTENIRDPTLSPDGDTTDSFSYIIPLASLSDITPVSNQTEQEVASGEGKIIDAGKHTQHIGVNEDLYVHGENISFKSKQNTTYSSSHSQLLNHNQRVSTMKNVASGNNLNRNANSKVLSEQTQISSSCKPDVAVCNKETQTLTGNVSVAEVQTEESTLDCELREKLEKTQLKLRSFYKDVHQLLRLSYTDLIPGNEEDLENIIRNLIEVKQEQQDQLQTQTHGED